MRTINIYQIKDITECKYAFCGWDYAQDKCKMDDYQLAAHFGLNDDEDDILNTVWTMGNTGFLQKQFKMRSVSVSDIIEVNGKMYYVDTFGFKEVE